MNKSSITKTLFSLLTALFIISAPLQAQSTWKVDPPHAKVVFATVHNTISDIQGQFRDFQATLTGSDENLTEAAFTLKIDATSIDTGVKARDNHLKSSDFFNVKKYPTITFKSTSIEETGEENRYKLTGDLTMHGVTKTVTMDLWYRGTIKNPQNGDITAGFQITGTLDRTDFNIGTKFPESLISNEVKIIADGEFIKQES